MKLVIQNICYTCGLLIFCSILKSALTKLITDEDFCQVEDAALGQWYSQMLQYVQANQNTGQHIFELTERLRNLEVQALNQQEMMRTLNEKIDQLQLKTNGDIVIQRRQDGSVDFLRSWADYKLGFGNSSGEFFIGLEKLHKLTNSRPYELLVVMEDWENDRRYAKYDQFIVGSEAEKYALKQLGKYSGSAGDSLSDHMGHKFSTSDQDNDAAEAEHCAARYTGAWWYNACHSSNLNGRYLKGKMSTDGRGQGVHWKPFKGHFYSLKFVEMTIRPK